MLFFFKQETSVERRISDWSSDVCSSDLDPPGGRDGWVGRGLRSYRSPLQNAMSPLPPAGPLDSVDGRSLACLRPRQLAELLLVRRLLVREEGVGQRSEEHTSELQSLMRISYAVFCLKKKNTTQQKSNHYT